MLRVRKGSATYVPPIVRRRGTTGLRTTPTDSNPEPRQRTTLKPKQLTEEDVSTEPPAGTTAEEHALALTWDFMQSTNLIVGLVRRGPRAPASPPPTHARPPAGLREVQVRQRDGGARL